MVRYGTPQGRAVLLARILGSGLVQLSSTVLYVVLPPIGEDLDVGITGLQWILSGSGWRSRRSSCSAGRWGTGSGGGGCS